MIVPAHNEAAVLERCLQTMLGDYVDGEFEVVVVANGCTDQTAEIARSFGAPVRVIETPVPSKSKALNLGDDEAQGFPRMYVDADVDVRTDALRAVAAALTGPSAYVVAAPRAEFSVEGCTRTVRSFVRVWSSLPYFTEGVVGAGFYAFSEAGRGRFGRFPELIADDEFARRVARPHERGRVEGESFTIRPPATVRSLLHVMVRVRAGLKELEREFPASRKNRGTGKRRTLRTIAKRPSLWPHAPIYLAIMFAASVRASRKLRTNRDTWERDETSRGGGPSGT
ncbi:MAG: glycosyltransferase [Nannocystaceae bacterium]|nr:glycosyltransferase [Nannocystaceae bacterium]